MLITPEYRKQQEELHKNPNYGVASVKFAPLVAQIVNKLKVDHLLDYGAGKMRLFQSMKGLVDHKMKLQAYDPGVPELSVDPVPADMVVCIDVLEHIEPECLDAVLNHLEKLTENIGFFTVHTGPAAKVLSDGRNAHLIQEPAEWWLPKFMERWDLQTFQRLDNGFYVIVYNNKLIEHGDLDIQRTENSGSQLAA